MSSLSEAAASELAELFAREAPELFKYAVTIPHVGRADADDLVQTTFQAAASRWETSLRELDCESRRKWLYRVLRNKAIDQWRGDTRLCRSPDPIGVTATPVEDTPDRVLSRIALRNCWAAIQEMPPARQRVAFLRWGEDRKPGEIAALLGISPDTVRAHVKLARDALIAQVGPAVPFIDSDDAGEEAER